MQNDEYYNLYMVEWDKLLRGQNDVTDAEREELHELMQKQAEGSDAE